MVRIILAGFLFGNPFSILYSLSGGALSFLAMYVLKRTEKLKVVTVSVAGGVMHNTGQLIMAALVVENYHILYYIPVLLTAGFITGFFIGILSQEIILRIGNRI